MYCAVARLTAFCTLLFLMHFDFLQLQIDASVVSVLYENGDSEDLPTSDVLRDGLLSLGWVPGPRYSVPADSEPLPSPSPQAASAAGDQLIAAL